MVTKMMSINSKMTAIIKDYLIITFGLLVFAMGWILFLIPAEIAGGGISGVSAVIFFATGFPVGLSYLIINVVLVLIAIKILGANFGIKTIFSIVVVSLIFALFPEVLDEPIVDDDFLFAGLIIYYLFTGRM